jgi:hypothetical protein
MRGGDTKNSWKKGAIKKTNKHGVVDGASNRKKII